ncbi:MAG: DNA gyrase subunit A, partial [Glaciecola sp.]
SEVSTVGRNTQGVRLIRTAEDELVVALQRIDEVEQEILEDLDGESTEDTAEIAESTDTDLSNETPDADTPTDSE